MFGFQISFCCQIKFAHQLLGILLKHCCSSTAEQTTQTPQFNTNSLTNSMLHATMVKKTKSGLVKFVKR